MGRSREEPKFDSVLYQTEGASCYLSAMTLIYKLLPASLWREAEAAGVFAGAGIDLADGYIHFSTRAQVEETAARYFAGVADLLLVAVEAEPLGDALKWEASRGGDLFPHLYGTLPVARVAKVSAPPMRADGGHDFAGLLE
jgi:uncharacterized protein (DUF952 family)